MTVQGPSIEAFKSKLMGRALCLFESGAERNTFDPTLDELMYTSQTSEAKSRLMGGSYNDELGV